MKNKLPTLLFALLAACGSVYAQQYVGQDGHLLDANNRVGSMGWNGNGRIDALNNRSNNMITGNVTGGMSFQGLVPYSSSYEFQGNSNMNTLGNFRRDSVGISQVSSGQTFGQYYVNSDQGVTTSFQGRIYNTQKALNFSVAAPVSSFSGYNNSLNNSMSQSPYSTASTTDSSFSKLSTPQLKLVYNYTNFSTLSNSKSFQKLLKKDMLASRNIDSEISNAQMFTKENYILTYNQQLEFNDFQNIQDQQNKKQPEKDYEEQLYFPDKNSNKIFDDKVSSNSVTSHQKTFQQLAARYQSYIKAGIEDMQKGRYYKAVDNFSLAQIYAEANSVEPLKYLAISRFAAGEYISASLDIFNAFNVSFDETMQPIDLQILFGSDLTVYYGVKNIEQNYKLTDNQSLLLLLGYIEYSAGDLDASETTFQKLAELQQDNILLTKISKHISDLKNKQISK